MKMSVGLVALVLLAGCGGDSSEPDSNAADTATATATHEASGGDTMTAATWSKQVEAICTTSEKKAFAAGKKLGQKSAKAGDSQQELTYKILGLESKLLGPWIDQIDALPKPAGQEDAANKFIANMRATADLLGKTATAIKDNDETNGKQLLKQLTAKTQATRTQARALHIEKCNPSPQGAGSPA
jgi:hypothetical protein